MSDLEKEINETIAKYIRMGNAYLIKKEILSLSRIVANDKKFQQALDSEDEMTARVICEDIIVNELYKNYIASVDLYTTYRANKKFKNWINGYVAKNVLV